MSDQPTSSSTSGETQEPADKVCPTWRGEKYVAKGGIFFGDCLDCGWPKADHQAVDNGGPS